MQWGLWRSSIWQTSILINAWITTLCTVRIKLINFVEASFKCFDNYLSFVSQTYYGLPIVSNFGKNKAENGASTGSSSNLIKASINQTSNGINGVSSGPILKISGSEHVPEDDSVVFATPNGVSLNKQKDKNRFKMTTFDILTNPLRADHPFGKFWFIWDSPYFLTIYLSIIKLLT